MNQKHSSSSSFHFPFECVELETIKTQETSYSQKSTPPKPRKIIYPTNSEMTLELPKNKEETLQFFQELQQLCSRNGSSPSKLNKLFHFIFRLIDFHPFEWENTTFGFLWCLKLLLLRCGPSAFRRKKVRIQKPLKQLLAKKFPNHFPLSSSKSISFLLAKHLEEHCWEQWKEITKIFSQEFATFQEVSTFVVTRSLHLMRSKKIPKTHSVHEGIYLGMVPSQRDLAKLVYRSTNIGRPLGMVVSAISLQEYQIMSDIYRPLDLCQLKIVLFNVPLPDFTRELTEHVIAKIHLMMVITVILWYQQRSILFHCKAGKGRSVQVAIPCLGLLHRYHLITSTKQSDTTHSKASDTSDLQEGIDVDRVFEEVLTNRRHIDQDDETRQNVKRVVHLFQTRYPNLFDGKLQDASEEVSLLVQSVKQTEAPSSHLQLVKLQIQILYLFLTENSSVPSFFDPLYRDILKQFATF